MEESKISKFQWFLVIFIPLIFAVTVALIVLTVAGVNVADKAKEMSAKIPFIESGKRMRKKEMQTGMMRKFQSNWKNWKRKLKPSKKR